MRRPKIDNWQNNDWYIFEHLFKASKNNENSFLLNCFGNDLKSHLIFKTGSEIDTLMNSRWMCK